MIKNRPFALHTIDKEAKEATIYIYGGIPDIDWNDYSYINTSREFIKEFKALEADYDTINIRINSPGGFVDEGLGMFNTIRQSKAKINTYNDGVAASMGAVLLMAGDNVYASKNSLTMIHNVWGVSVGTAQDLREAADVSDKFDAVLISAFADKMGKDAEEVKAKYFDFKDHWFTAQEAETEGLVKVLEYEAKIDEKVQKNMKLSDLQNVFSASAKDVSNKNDNMGILELFGFSKDTASKLTAEDKQKLESADEKLSSMVAELDSAKAELAASITQNGTLTTQVEELTSEVSTLNESNETLTAENTELKAQLEKKPAAAATTATSVKGEDDQPVPDRELHSWEKKAIKKTQNIKK